MPAERHAVLRQVIEFTVRSEAEARRVHADAARLFRDSVWPLLDLELARCSDPETLLRLDSVQIDLGHLPEESFAEAANDRLKQVIGPALTLAIRAAESAAGGPRNARTASHFELLARFIETGTLPWWADASEPGLIGQTLLRLCRDAPRRLTGWFRGRSTAANSLRRLVRVCHDDDLDGLLHLLQPEGAAFLRPLVNALIGLVTTRTAQRSWHPEGARQSAWLSVLSTAVDLSADAEHSELLRQVIRRFATSLGASETEVIAALAPQSAATPAAARELIGLLAAIMPAGTVPASAADDLDVTITGMQPTGTSWAGFWEALRPFLARFPTSERTALCGLLAQAGRDPFDPASNPAATASDFEHWLHSALASGGLPRQALDAWLTQVDRPQSRGEGTLHSHALLLKSVQAVLKQLPPSLQADEDEAQETLADSKFSDADAVYIDNAGLVVLWPFLENFFVHLGLVEARQFKSDAARHRAAGLLQYLATEDRSPLEYHLPLNKVLCGIEVEAEFDFGAPVSDDERIECDQLLEAVIAQAPILKQMSLAGFRGTFLQRKGQLTARDDTWLLRVERETYDVVLDRFPWPIQWVRLPWMTALMQVEW